MAKTKNKKRVNADVLTSKKATTQIKKHNPFEVHTNKEKFTVLGRQLKHDKGMPGVSRAKALTRRKKTLGQEYLNSNKTNTFKDNRIGARYMTKDEAASARFVAEQLKQIKNKKKSKFNLDDDDQGGATGSGIQSYEQQNNLLTHKGQTLENIEQFKDNAHSDDEDMDNDDQIGKLDAQFTDMAHFGGGGGGSGGYGDGHGGGMTQERQSAIDNLIAEQKRRKIEILKEKEEVSTMTQKLDTNWKDLMKVMAKMGRSDEIKKPKADDYDRAMREMIFEPRGAVSDKLKSEADIVKIEKEKLEELERQRLERMQGVTEEDKKIQNQMTHRSADDLDDGYYVQPVTQMAETLTYDMNGETMNEGSENDEDDDDDSDAKELLKMTKEHKNDSDDENGEEEEEEEDDDEDGDDDDDDEDDEDDADSLNDLKYDSESGDDETTNKKKPIKTTASSKIQKIIPKLTNEDRLEIIKKASAELPYTFELPETYEDLEFIFNKRNAEFQGVILERMIKCNHPKVVPANKPKMITLFAYLLQHINDTFDDDGVGDCGDNIQHSFRVLDQLGPYIFDLAQINPIETAQCFKEVLKEKQSDQRDQKQYPTTMSTFAFLKLASNLYSTSDFRHEIITPCFIFLSQLLSRCRITRPSDLAKGLFLVTIIQEYTQLSHRFLPSAWNFLAGVFYLATKKSLVAIAPALIVPPFRTTIDQNSLLLLERNCKTSLNQKDNQKLKSQDLVSKTKEFDDDSFKIKVLNVALCLARSMLTNLIENIGGKYFVALISEHLDKINTENYPEFINDNLLKLQSICNEINEKKMIYLQTAAKKPKVLRTLEPKFEKIYDDKRTRDPEKIDRAIRQGMIRKVKSETRGAIREIRRDNVFLSKMKLKKQMQSDAERREKVKQIYSEASIQQGELNAMDRKKKHM